MANKKTHLVQIGRILSIALTGCVLMTASDKPKNRGQEQPSVIDQILSSAGDSNSPASSSGSTFAADGFFADLTSDFRARNLGDLLTIIVADQASAVSKGATSQKRGSSANAGVNSLFGPLSPKQALPNLASINGQQQLDGQGSTSRQTTLSTNLSARVIKVLPNGDLVVEGTKLIAVNSEYQTVSLRGLVRPVDLGPSNTVRSDRIADLEVRINGRGVVNDAIRRPNFLYRLLLGVLPF